MIIKLGQLYTAPLTIDTNKNNICKKYRQHKTKDQIVQKVASLTVTNIDKTQPTVTFGTNGSTKNYKKSQSTTVTVKMMQVE